MEEKEKKLIAYLENLPRLQIYEDFAARVMEEIERKNRFILRVKRLVVVPLAGFFLALMLLTNLPTAPRFEISSYLGYRRIELVFYAPSQNPKTVAVAGDFSDWNYLSMDKIRENCWKITIRLRPGKYQYGFLVDGKEWVPDPNAPRQIADGFGNLNSVLVVDGVDGE